MPRGYPGPRRPNDTAPAANYEGNSESCFINHEAKAVFARMVGYNKLGVNLSPAQLDDGYVPATLWSRSGTSHGQGNLEKN